MSWCTFGKFPNTNNGVYYHCQFARLNQEPQICSKKIVGYTWLHTHADWVHPQTRRNKIPKKLLMRLHHDMYGAINIDTSINLDRHKYWNNCNIKPEGFYGKHPPPSCLKLKENDIDKISIWSRLSDVMLGVTVTLNRQNPEKWSTSLGKFKYIYVFQSQLKFCTIS